MPNPFENFALALAGGDPNNQLRGQRFGAQLQGQRLRNQGLQTSNSIASGELANQPKEQELARLLSQAQTGVQNSTRDFNLGKESRAKAGEQRLVDGLANLLKENPEIAKFVNAGVDGAGARAFQRVQNDDDITGSQLLVDDAKVDKLLAQELSFDADTESKNSLRLFNESKMKIGQDAAVGDRALTSQQEKTSASVAKLNETKEVGEALKNTFGAKGLDPDKRATLVNATIKMIRGSTDAFGGITPGITVRYEGKDVEGSNLTLDQAREVANAHVQGTIKIPNPVAGDGSLKNALKGNNNKPTFENLPDVHKKAYIRYLDEQIQKGVNMASPEGDKIASDAIDERKLHMGTD